MRLRAAVAPIPVALALLAGCTRSTPGGSPTPSPTGSGSGSATATPTPAPSAAALPDSCGDLLPILDLDQALGRPLLGRTDYIEGVPEPKIKRLGRVTCRYGIRTVLGKRPPPPPLEVGVSAYADAAAATDRVETTVIASRSEGAGPRTVQVAGMAATALLGKSPLLVFAVDTRTLAVTFGPGLVRGDPAKRLVAVAELALKNLPK
jgi:hypothetical protein